MRPLLFVLACLIALPGPVAAQLVNTQPTNIITSSGGRYTLRAGDVLRVDVWGREEYSGLFQVNEEGFLYYPVLGDIDANDITVAALRDTLLAGLETLFVNPFISVTPLFRVAVAGHVVRPGLYTVDPTLSVLDVVSMAGGATDLGNANKIRVVRPGEARELNFEAEIVAGRTLEEVGVRSGDDIIVPRKFFARQDWFIVLQMATVILSVAIFINTLP